LVSNKMTTLIQKNLKYYEDIRWYLISLLI
jgi:hypothetical protein